MPAIPLSERAQPIRRYDVIGVHSASGAFVKHVALCNVDEASVCRDQDVDVVHMGPPLDVAGKARAHVAGTVPLTNEEAREIGIWLAETADEYARFSVDARHQYYVHPAWQDYPSTGVRRYRRYSCAGFVLDAYRQVDIALVDLDEEQLPPVDDGTLRRVYPELRSSRHLRPFGIDGPGPWLIVLPGYVLHALARTQEEIRRRPYQARGGDEQFPA